MEWWTIVTALLMVLSTVLGIYWKKARKKLKLIAELIIYLDKAIEDNVITQEEGREIVKKIKAILQDP